MSWSRLVDFGELAGDCGPDKHACSPLTKIVEECDVHDGRAVSAGATAPKDAGLPMFHVPTSGGLYLIKT
jgi:hypothetical protein